MVLAAGRCPAPTKNLLKKGFGFPKAFKNDIANSG
jgi:hypothetical protein